MSLFTNLAFCVLPGEEDLFVSWFAEKNVMVIFFLGEEEGNGGGGGGGGGGGRAQTFVSHGFMLG